MTRIWLPVNPHEPQEQMNRDQQIASVVRYGVRAKTCPLCGCTGILCIGHLDMSRSTFECGTEVGLGHVSRGKNCHWECRG